MNSIYIVEVEKVAKKSNLFIATLHFNHYAPIPMA